MPRESPPKNAILCAALVAAWGLAIGCNGDLRFERGPGAFCDGPSACTAGLYCNLEEQRCESLRVQGDPCTSAQQCSIGLCVHGYCCDGPCNEACLSCGLNGSLGVCSTVPEGTDPEDQCPGTAVCSEFARCQGTHLWSRRIGSPHREEATGVAVTDDGVIFVTGSFSGSLTIGDDSYDSAGERDVFLAAFVESPNGPEPIWSVAFGSEGDDVPRDLAVDSQGRPVVVGSFDDAMLILQQGLLAADRDGFVVRLEPDGSSVSLVASFFGPGVQSIDTVAVDAQDALILGGVFEQEIQYGPTDIVPSSGGTDAFVARMEASGAVAWHRELGDEEDQRCRAVGIGAGSGEVVAAVEGRGTVDTGNGSIAGSVQDDDLFLVRLDAVTGDGKAVLLFGGQGDQSANALVIDDDDEIWLAGRFTRELLGPGGPPLIGGEDVNGFFSKLTSTGAQLASVALSGPFDDEPIGLTIDHEGNAIVVGRFELELELGETGSTIDATGAADLFLLKLNPNAEPLWIQPYGGLLSDRAVAVATTGNGDVIAVGDFEATIAFPESPLQAAGATDLFLAKFAR